MATEADNVNTPTIGALVLAGAIISLVTVLLLHCVYVDMHDKEWDEKIGSKLNAEANKIKGEQSDEIAKAVRWVDPTKKIVGIPISDAMEQVVRENTPEEKK